MNIGHDFLVGFSKSFGLFYLLAFSVGVGKQSADSGKGVPGDALGVGPTAEL